MANENNQVNDLLEEGKKNLQDLLGNLEKLGETARQIAEQKAAEVVKQADVIINEAKEKVEAAKSFTEYKVTEATNSEEFKNMESEGQKILQEAQLKMAEATVKATEALKEVSERLGNLFGTK